MTLLIYITAVFTPLSVVPITLTQANPGWASESHEKTLHVGVIGPQETVLGMDGWEDCPTHFVCSAFALILLFERSQK